MKKLPTEIIVDITTYLAFADKLSLACVSKQLYTTISENILYNKLVFNDVLKFDKAVEVQSEKNIGQQVRYLSLNLDHYAQLVPALPTVFSRLRFLEIKSYYESSANAINSQNCQLTTTNWNSVESIVDISHIINISLRLLQLLTFDHLTSLELNCMHDENRN